MNISAKLTKIKEEELLEIWDNFTDIMIEDKHTNPNEEIMEFFEVTVRELASGEEILLNVAYPIGNLIGIFIEHFSSKEENTIYRFEFRNLIAEGSILK